jgi:hypothetical protein
MRGRLRLVGVLASTAAAFVAVLLAAGPATAAAVSIHDDAHVLDVTRVQNEAARLPDPVAIYTTTKFADDKAAFDREAQSKVTQPTMIAIAINTQSRHLAIRTGPKSRVSQQAGTSATQLFISSYRSNPDYTAATIATLDSLRSALPSAPGPSAGPAEHKPTKSSGGSFIGSMFCLLLVVLIVVGIIVAVVRFTRRSRRPRQVSGPPRGDAGGGFGDY